MKETAIAMGIRDAASKGSFYLFDPDQLLLITDERHPLYDPRALEKPDDALVQSMMTFGFKTSSSIEVESTNDGMVVVDGRRRVLAAREVKRLQIKNGDEAVIRVRCLCSKDQPFIGMILGNAHRKDESLLQKAAKAQRALGMGRTEQEVANLFGVTKQTIKNWLEAMLLPTDIKKALDADKITMTLALQLAKKPPEEQAQVLATAETTPIRGEQGKARVKSPPKEEVSKKLTTAQVRKLHTALVEDGRANVNIELAAAILGYILGEDPTGRKLIPFDPLRDIIKSADL